MYITLIDSCMVNNNNKTLFPHMGAFHLDTLTHWLCLSGLLIIKHEHAERLASIDMVAIAGKWCGLGFPNEVLLQHLHAVGEHSM